ncbi:insulinase family protein [Natronosporangium hydrolyticum]|uniref:Insulinase family protein n=1 Tax=Natronosporangium hydrolyticum TaxID=2811111 RepID=A0A895YFW2_9ACTN|nr:insulinase family protein [Natronosporangium hydrolyticum]QSB12558.1 insulinase family protein [Natronosporangium hydrolyticum]
MKQLEQLTPGDVAGFHHRYYGPGNATLTLVGDIDPASAVRLAEACFGDLAPRIPPELPSMSPAGNRSQQAVVLESSNLPDDRVHLGFRIPPVGDPEHDVVTVLGAVLGLGRGSLLARSLVEGGLVLPAGELMTVWRCSGDSSLLVAGLRAAPGVKAEEVEAAARDVMEAAWSQMVEDDLQRASALVVAQVLRHMETVSGRADFLSEMTTVFGDPLAATGFVHRIRAVSLDDLRDTARRLLVSDDAFVVKCVARRD